MKVNIYYGGRGLVDDPTLFVIGKIEEVLKELKVQVTRFNLYEMKNTIATLSQTVTEADAVVLATTVEWLGMGGYMQTFLDSCWLYGDKSKISEIYMFPVVMAKTYGEKEVTLTLTNSWEMIGGKVANGLSGYVDDTAEFEFNEEYTAIVEKQAEMIYRTVTQKTNGLPSSSQTIKKNVMKDTIRLTPQESEQLSKYVSDDTFVKTQKKDIESLASIYKELLSDQENGGDNYYIDVFKNNFDETCQFSSSYMIMVSDKDKKIVIDTNQGELSVAFGENPNADVIAKLDKETFDNIVDGRVTFHRAFMTGDMTAKGNLKTLRMLDELFTFCR
jgi:putative sterol carrier protein/multimeric flavodoxin WrbA